MEIFHFDRMIVSVSRITAYTLPSIYKFVNRFVRIWHDQLWGELQKLQKEERAKGGVLDMETEIVSSLTAYGPGYINEAMKDLEQIVGLQTDKPLKRAFMPYGGIHCLYCSSSFLLFLI